MRKNILSLSIAAMIGGLGFVGNASAMGVLGSSVGSNPATSLAVTPLNKGHILFVPYYTVQNGNATLFNIVNTDTVNGKAVKVRFRAASNSDDVFDFQLYLSAGDVWAASISTNNAGSATMATKDNSCTLPASVNQPFVLDRLPPVSATFTAAQRAAYSREGYIEIFNMADIPPVSTAGSLSRSITHASGVPACAGLTALGLTNDLANDAAAFAKGFSYPTTGLFANYTIINVSNTLTFSGEAVAVIAQNAGGAAQGNIVWFPQTSATASAPIDNFTADPLLRTLNTNAPGAVTAAMFDLPDLSTPYTTNVSGAVPTSAGPLIQAFLLTSAIATTAVTNEFVTDPTIVAQTDWVFSMPTRRYNMAANYAVATTAANRRAFTDYTATGVAGLNYFTAANTFLNPADSNQICVNVDTPAYYDRSETTQQSGFVISPGTAVAVALCGETSVLSFNAGGSTSVSVLGASIARQDVTLPYTDGWSVQGTTGLNGKGLPILGKMFLKAFNNGVQAGVSGNFGANYEHKYTR